MNKTFSAGSAGSDFKQILSQGEACTPRGSASPSRRRAHLALRQETSDSLGLGFCGSCSFKVSEATEDGGASPRRAVGASPRRQGLRSRQPDVRQTSKLLRRLLKEKNDSVNDIASAPTATVDTWASLRVSSGGAAPQPKAPEVPGTAYATRRTPSASPRCSQPVGAEPRASLTELCRRRCSRLASKLQRPAPRKVAPAPEPVRSERLARVVLS